MTSATTSSSRMKPGKLRRLGATLRQFGHEQIKRADAMDALAARAVMEFGENNLGAADWLQGLAGSVERRGSSEDRELERIARRADYARSITNQVAVRVDVRVGEGAEIDPAQVDAVRELCQMAPAVVSYLVRRRAEEEAGAALALELHELEERGVAIECGADGELRCRPTALAVEVGHGR